MNRFKALKRVREEARVSSLFPITHLNSSTVFETQQGFLGATLHVQGVSFVTEETGVLNQHAHRLHQAFLNLDEQWIQYVTLHRKKENLSLENEFHSTFAKQVNDKYHARFAGKPLYRNDLYLTTVLKGDTSSQVGRTLSWFQRLQRKSYHWTLHREQKLSTLTAKMEQLKTSLSSFKPHLLGSLDQKLGYSELLTFLSLIPNGGKTLSFQHPDFCAPIANSIPQTWNAEALYPQGHLGQYLCNQQLFFGNTLQFQGASQEDCRFAALLSIKKYGQSTSSLMLDPLLELDAEFILTHSFAPIARDTALKTIQRKRDKLNNAKDLGMSQIAQLSLLEDQVASDAGLLGYHHNTLLLIGDNLEELELSIRNAVKAYASAGIVVVKETLGAELAFWAQLPGNHHFITRASLITSQNFVDFSPLHNYATGFRDGNHLGAAVTLLETPSKTPVYFNYHSQSSKTNPAKGHTIIYGATNAGKNTLVAFLDSQMGRYRNRSFFIERDEASKIYVLASGNSAYTVISPSRAQRCRMNPLQLPDNKSHRAFLKDWLSQLVKRPNEDDLPSHLTETLNECINYAFDHLEPRYRTLSHISRCLPVDFERWPELRRWLRSQEGLPDGEYAWLFDNGEDALSFDFDKVGFDITYLIDEVSPLIATPVYLYLLHRMRDCLDGRLTSFIIDEFWQVLSSPFWVKHLKSWLATIRKKNGHFIFMTQSPETVVESSLRTEVLTNVATTIFFPNPMASAEVYQHHLGLSAREFNLIQSLTPESRLFLYKQGQDSMLCKLDLTALSDEIRVFSGNQASVRLLDNLMEEVGCNPDVWLPLFLKRSQA